MKKLLFALTMCLATVAAFAQDATTTPAPQDDKAKTEEMQPVAAADLPAPVTAALQGQDYSGWTVANATKKEKDGKTIYKVELTKGSEKKTVKMDAEGNMVKGKDKDKDKSVQ